MEVRLDKWLWAARFYKTRSYATDSVKSGRVHVDGQRVKPSKHVKIGQVIQINKASQRYEVELTSISDKRCCSSVAQHLYRETPESIKQREREMDLRKLSNHYMDNQSKGRPTKRNRRLIVKFNQKDD